MTYKEKYNYPSVTSEHTSKQGRVYFIEHNNVKYEAGLPSVTTIISSQDTETKEAIKKWRNSIGIEKADEITKQSTDLGTAMHDLLYYRLIGKPVHNEYNSFIMDMATKMADKIYDTYLKNNLDEIWGAEVPLFVPGMYAGRVDLVGVYNGEPAIIDFKNARREKSIEHMQNYFVQEAAYATAHNYLFKTNIKKAVTLVAQRLPHDIVPKEVIVDDVQFVSYQEKWLNMVKEYHQIQ
jgi:ATP-dependent exoDNAse (exonuclease V) beta subunit